MSTNTDPLTKIVNALFETIEQLAKETHDTDKALFEVVRMLTESITVIERRLSRLEQMRDK